MKLTHDSIKEQLRAELAAAERKVEGLRKMLALADEIDELTPAEHRAGRAASPAPSVPKKPAKKAAPKTMAASLGASMTAAAAKMPEAAKEVRAMSVEGVLSVLRGQANGLRSEEIRQRLRLPASAQRRLSRVMKRGVKEKRLVVKGVKRATRYYAP